MLVTGCCALLQEDDSEEQEIYQTYRCHSLAAHASRPPPPDLAAIFYQYCLESVAAGYVKLKAGD
jgi:hypothetical protein